VGSSCFVKQAVELIASLAGVHRIHILKRTCFRTTGQVAISSSVGWPRQVQPGSKARLRPSRSGQHEEGSERVNRCSSKHKRFRWVDEKSPPKQEKLGRGTLLSFAEPEFLPHRLICGPRHR
jgi:hypothetical protein